MFKAFPTLKHVEKPSVPGEPGSIRSHELPKQKKTYNYLPTTRFCAEMISFSKLLKGPRVKTFHLEHAPGPLQPWNTKFDCYHSNDHVRLKSGESSGGSNGSSIHLLQTTE